jgi:hypothetical protein
MLKKKQKFKTKQEAIKMIFDIAQFVRDSGEELNAYDYMSLSAIVTKLEALAINIHDYVQD